jgi:hypothetical protein
MALLKSQALLLEELRAAEAEQCYKMLAGWAPQEPVITPIVELPTRKAKEDTTPFGYDYSHLPSRNASRHRIFSEL